MSNPSKQRSDLFWEKVHITDGCWLWTGAKNPNGYGQFFIGDRTVHAHRYAWATYMQERPLPPSDLFIMHTCDNPGCVRPTHLIAGSHKDNMADMRAKGRSRSAIKTANHHRKLTDTQVSDIRARHIKRAWFPSPGSTGVLAEEFGVSKTYICELISGKWRK